MAADRIELKVLFLSVAAVIAVEAAVGALASHGPASQDKASRLILVGVMRLVQTSLIVSIAVRWGSGWSGFGLARSMLGRGIQKGVVWSVAFGCCALTMGLLLFFAGMNPLELMSSKSPTAGAEVFLLFVVGGLIGPVAEEVFFRGICYGFFRRWGVAAAIALTTTIFVLAHGVKTGNLPFPQIVGGIVFALAYEREKSLLVPIIIHVSGNLALFAISLGS
jgi:uncharacterized protein